MLNKIKALRNKNKSNKALKENHSKPGFKEARTKILNLFKTSKYINTNDVHRQEARVLNTLSYAFQGSLLFNFILVGVILFLMPLKERVPYFVHFLTKEEQIVHIQPYRKTRKQERQIKEFMARDYVYKRETLDLATEEERWKIISFWSTPSLKKSFIELYDPENLNSPYAIAVNQNTVRFIRIIRSSILNDNQYQVEFEMTDSLKATGKVMTIKVAIATITFIENKDTFKGEDGLYNPFGWLIDDYSIGIKAQKDNEVENAVLFNNFNKHYDNN